MIAPVIPNRSLRSYSLVRTNWMFRILAFLTLALIVIVVCALIYAPWQQTSFGQGRVVAYAPDDRLQNLSTPVDGRISRWYVSEGQRVKKGDAIVDISDLDPQFIDRLKSELDAAVRKVEAAQQGAETSKLNLDRQKLLAGRGLSSQRAFELAQIEYAKMLSDLSSATAELARIEVRFSRQASQVVTAPREGTIQRIFGAQGGVVVKAGDLVATFVPDTKSRAVELLMDGNDVPLISVGRHVRVQFEGWPAVQFVGWPSVAVGTFGGTVGVVDPTDDGSGRFRVIIFPDPNEDKWPDAKFLRQGIRAQGWILLDTVSLGYELWRRFNGFPQSVSQPFEVDSGDSGKATPKRQK